MRELAAFTLRSPQHAIFLVGLFGVLALLFVPLGFISAAALALVMLRLGWRAGFQVVAGAAVPLLVGAWLIPMKSGFGVFLVPGLWLLSLSSAAVLRRSESQGLAAIVVTGVCAALVLVLHLVTGDPGEFWKDQGFGEGVGGVPGMDEEELRKVGAPPRLLTGLIGLMVGLGSMVALLLARWWQSVLFNPGGFGQEFRRYSLPRTALLITAATLFAAAWVDTTLMDDLFIVSTTMYFFSGLAVIHGIVAKRRISPKWLAPAYVALVIVPHFALIGLAFLGAVDVFVNFRALAKRY